MCPLHFKRASTLSLNSINLIMWLHKALTQDRVNFTQTILHGAMRWSTYARGEKINYIHLTLLTAEYAQSGPECIHDDEECWVWMFLSHDEMKWTFRSLCCLHIQLTICVVYPLIARERDTSHVNMHKKTSSHHSLCSNSVSSLDDCLLLSSEQILSTQKSQKKSWTFVKKLALVWL